VGSGGRSTLVLKPCGLNCERTVDEVGGGRRGKIESDALALKILEQFRDE
jgi:hypothetical protein